MPYRALAKRAGFSASTLSVAASGAVLPSLDVTLAYVQACGGNPDLWRERWHALVAQQACETTAAPVRAESCDAPPLVRERRVRQVPDVMDPTTADGATESARFGARWLLAMLASMAIPLFAFAAVAGVTGVQVTPSVLGPVESAASRLQIAELYGVICEGPALHADTNASVDLRVGRGWSQPRVQDFFVFAGARFLQADWVSAQDVSQIPDGPLIARSLGDYYRDRAVADVYHALSAGSPAASALEAAGGFDLAQSLDRAAQASGNEAVRLWNSDAQAVGAPRISEAML